MNFGYPFTPFQTPMKEEMYETGYMSQPQMGCMNQPQFTSVVQPQYQTNAQSGCNQVVQNSFVEEMPYYVNYHTHAVSNLCYIKWSKNAKKVPKSGVFGQKLQFFTFHIFGIQLKVHKTLKIWYFEPYFLQ